MDAIISNIDKQDVMPKKPAPAAIRDLRARAGLTAEKAAALIHVAPRSWQRYESGERKMHPGLFELFVEKAGLQAC